MKMKSTTLKFLTALLGIPFLIATQSSSMAAEKKHAHAATPAITGPSCAKEKADFKKLYIELQKSLNYEGKDAYLDSKGAVALKAHTGNEYEGKVFEEALFKEYQNSLRKVALMYQAAKFDSSAPAEFKSNPELVNFIQAIDGNDGAKYISSNNVNSVIDGLQKASIAKYPPDSKFRINDNDKYLLKKLLTHAQDRLCSIEKFQETGKRDKNFTAEELEKKKNAPLNQLILAVKDAKITKDSDIKLEPIVDEKVAINSAIAANINALTEWMKKNKSCLPVIKSTGFMNSIQAGIQQCNYRKFVDALSDENVTNIESILHFINSNEKFLKGSQAKAETAMDELKLQAYVDRTFANLGNKINCTEITNSSKDGKRLFVRNLPYNDATNKFDTSKISCKIKTKVTKKTPIATEKVLTEQECSQKIELISDELGRGLEVKQKNPNEAIVSFSIKDNPDCTDIDLIPSLTEAVKPDMTPAMCKKEGEAQTPKKDLIPSTDKKSCVDNAVKTDEICKAEGLKEVPTRDLIADKDGKTCILVIVILKTEVICKAEGEALQPPKTLVPSDDKKSCIEKSVDKTDVICKAEGESQKPPKTLVPSDDKKSCIEKSVDKTDVICKAEGESQKPPKALVPSDDKKSCIEKSTDKTDQMCTDEGNAKNPKQVLVPGDDKKSCVEKKKEEDKKEENCLEQNAKKAKELGRDENDPLLTDFEMVKGVCVDKKDKGGSRARDTVKEEPEVKAKVEQPYSVPARFVPIQIPTRQMYILPGMP
ncbi:MAG: hypothetical protein H7177_16690 [Rhizobacter sp.]|nr:hypothetical protein [Bacteriovorax sp.]